MIHSRKTLHKKRANKDKQDYQYNEPYGTQYVSAKRLKEALGINTKRQPQYKDKNSATDQNSQISSTYFSALDKRLEAPTLSGMPTRSGLYTMTPGAQYGTNQNTTYSRASPNYIDQTVALAYSQQQATPSAPYMRIHRETPQEVYQQEQQAEQARQSRLRIGPATIPKPLENIVRLAA